MHPEPVVAIIVPTLNRPHTLVPCLASICAQTFEQWICLVINQGEPVVRSKDTRFIYVDLHRKSASHARNLGLHLARGLCAQYVCLIDDDDWIEPTYMEEMVGAIEARPDAVSVACNGTYEGKTYVYDHPSTKLIGSRMVCASAIGTRTFEARSGQEKHFWRLCGGDAETSIDKVLYHASCDPAGGLRDPEGSH